MKSCPEVPSANFIIEPEPKGTAAVVGLAAMILLRIDPEAMLVVLPADHVIKNVLQFHKTIRCAVQAASENHLVTLGIPPDYPATGYGYIHRGEIIGSSKGMNWFGVQSFHEKPNERMARKYCAAGDFDWNSGIFIWKAETILKELQIHMPELYQHLESIRQKMDKEIPKKWIIRFGGRLSQTMIWVMEKVRSGNHPSRKFGLE